MKSMFLRAALLGWVAVSSMTCSSGNDESEKIPFHHYFVYAANSGSNTISAYMIDLQVYAFGQYPTTGTGRLTPLAGSPFAAGASPGSMAVAESQVNRITDYLYVTNSGSHDISAYAIHDDTGILTPAGTFPAGTEPVSVVVDRVHLTSNNDVEFVYAANHGSDDISAYSIVAATGALSPVPGSPFDAGMGPSSLAIDGSGQFLYVANANSDSISAYAIDPATGALTQISGSPYPAGSGPCSAALFSDFFLYVVNANSNTISAYARDTGSGALAPIPSSPIDAGFEPRSITIGGGDHAYVTNRGSDSVSAYALDPTTGTMTLVAGSPFGAGTGPVSMSLDATGEHFAYVANSGSNNISAFTLNKTTGVLLPMAGSPFAAGTSPGFIVSTYTTPVFH